MRLRFVYTDPNRLCLRKAVCNRTFEESSADGASNFSHEKHVDFGSVHLFSLRTPRRRAVRPPLAVVVLDELVGLGVVGGE